MPLWEQKQRLNILEIQQKKIWGIKLKKYDGDLRAIKSLKKQLQWLDSSQLLSWRSFNRTFFGALRIEKNMLLLLVALIFVVVAINIYNGMRRLVFAKVKNGFFRLCLNVANYRCAKACARFACGKMRN